MVSLECMIFTMGKYFMKGKKRLLNFIKFKSHKIQASEFYKIQKL